MEGGKPGLVHRPAFKGWSQRKHPGLVRDHQGPQEGKRPGPELPWPDQIPEQERRPEMAWTAKQYPEEEERQGPTRPGPARVRKEAGPAWTGPAESRGKVEAGA
ncbi:hypothetical protein NDU88_000359 [Pleurodeles waltl]|uniref:Uncharacterized protein n=1 Tax=Pleurodeles waltl TaxID=8319 RepID=A0AAV7KP92_PLEWA|nr:hypothetical protein NDU88_000359 [Pleurodeles waltl]